MDGTSAADLSAMPNQFQSNTPLMQDPTAAPPRGTVLEQEMGRQVITPTKAPAPEDDPYDPMTVQAKVRAEEEAGFKQEAAAYGQNAAEMKAGVGKYETDVNAAVKASTDEIDAKVALMNQQQIKRDELAEKQAKMDEEKAARLQTDEQRLDDWVMKHPTRQAAAATAMHLAAPLSILTALGGALTRQSGIAMMGALNGVVEGIQQGADNKYNDAMDRWQSAYDQMKHHMETTKEVYNTYLDAYGKRVDAQDKAIEHTMTVMHENVQKEQLKIGGAKDVFNGKEKAWDAVMKYGVALAKIREARAARLESDAAMNQTIIDLDARRLLSGDDPTKIYAGGRGKNSFQYKNAVEARAVQIFKDAHRDDPEFAGRPELLQQAAADALVDARRIGMGIQRARIQEGAFLGKMDPAEKMLEAAIPLAKQAMDQYSAQFGRATKFIKYNDWWQHGEAMFSHPELRTLMISINHVLAEYNTLNARTGTSALADRIENMRMLAEADDPATFYAALARMHVEGVTTKQGLLHSLTDPLRVGLLGGDKGAAAGAGEGGPIAAPAPDNDPANLGIR